ncbi:MAG: LacI family DNA-binding transcriptional regulator [Victivallaceae bacterium]|nr:LacI family DNA-binding transcriptional regulator [Victivallaceae bacterium]
MNNGKIHRATLKDIAERAKVSLTAASMFINGKAAKYHLAEATCKRIQKAIAELNYIPNLHARAIASKRTLLLGMIISSDIGTSFWLNILSGIEAVVAKDDYHLILSVSHDDPVKERASIEFMLNKGIDGLFISTLLGKKDNHDFLRQLQTRLPVVTVNQGVDEVSGVFNDNYLGGELAAECLLKYGHRRIAYIGIMNIPRIIAFKARLARHGIKCAFFPSAAEFMKYYREFSAVFCFSDYVAVELYNLAAIAQLDIPRDFSVIGYDNMDFVRFTRPRLTTIEQSKKEIGISAGEIMMQALQSDSTPRKIVRKIFKPRLIDAESVDYET